MADFDLERFRLKVREYRLLVNRNQSDLASFLNLDYNELSSRLNANKKVRLSHDNVRAIVRALAEWGAITTRAQAEELLEMMLCPHFDSVDWQAQPLSKLAASAIHSTISQTPTPIGSGIFSLHKPFDTSFISSTHPGQNNLEVEVNHNLPHKLSSFIGRQNATASLTKLLVEDRTRLVTLIGVGGTGKTRLALHLGVQLLKHFAEGVWLIELAPLTNPLSGYFPHPT